MTMAEYLESLRAKGVDLWVEGNRLQYRAPKQAMTPALLSGLAERKTEICGMLQERAASCPLSHGQQAQWFLHQLEPQSAAHTTVFTAHMRSHIDVAALRHSFQILLDRHETLRATVTLRDGVPIHRLDGHAEVFFEVVDASRWDEQLLAREVANASARPFDLEHGPLLRVWLFQRRQTDAHSLHRWASALLVGPHAGQMKR